MPASALPPPPGQLTWRARNNSLSAEWFFASWSSLLLNTVSCRVPRGGAAALYAMFVREGESGFMKFDDEDEEKRRKDKVEADKVIGAAQHPSVPPRAMRVLLLAGATAHSSGNLAIRAERHTCWWLSSLLVTGPPRVTSTAPVTTQA